MKTKASLAQILDDQPAQVDYLDFETYSKALATVILEPATNTPLTLGIFGRWGTGKTTLMRMIEKRLNSERVISVWFNAWQYNKEDELWAAFLQSILNRLKDDMNWIQRSIFSLRLLRRRIDWRNFPGRLLKYLVRTAVVVAPILLSLLLSQQLTTQTSQTLVSMVGLVATVWLGWSNLLKPFWQAVQKNVTIDFSEFMKTADYQKHIAFLDDFRDHFKDIVQSLPSSNNKRLVVFIDDLDRCSPDRVLQVLDAVKLFVDVPGCVYIIGLDLEATERAIAGKYKDDHVAQREYLGKIIQLTFQLPPLTRREIEKFTVSIGIGLPDRRLPGVFIEGLSANLREIKRVINVFSLLWILANARTELSKSITPVRLAKIVVIQHVHLDLYKLLFRRPELLVKLEAYFRQVPQDVQSAGEGETIDTGDEVPGAKGPRKGNVSGRTLDLDLELEPFAQSDMLRRVLLMHELQDKDEDDANFLHLTTDQITAYFTLTWQTQQESRPEETILENRYRIIRPIAKGGEGSIFLAHDLAEDRDVAIKFVAPHVMTDPALLREIRVRLNTLGHMEHPNILRTYGYGAAPQGVFTVMEYMSGGSLESALNENPKWSVSDTMEVIVPVLDAVGYLHEHGTLHGDIKPANILFDSQGTPKISDFEMNRDLQGDSKWLDTRSVTPGYMAPDFVSRGAPDARSDLYSIGITLYRILTGQLPEPFTTRVSPRSYNQEISQELEEVMMKMIDLNRERRYASAEEAKQALIQAWRSSSRPTRTALPRN